MNGLKLVYFSNFELFLPNPRLIFPFVFDQVLNYWISFSLFWIGFPNQHLLRLLNLKKKKKKTRVIKPLIIYIILKKINILIYIEGAVRFVRFSYYKTANYTAPCDLVRYGALLLKVWCSYVILRAVLVRFLRFVWFMRFGEHPYLTQQISQYFHNY